MKQAKKIKEPEKMNKAKNTEGAKEVTAGQGRKPTRDEMKTKASIRKRQRDRGERYSPKSNK